MNKYADLLVNFALNNGKGIKRGDVVYLIIYESAKPLLVEILKEAIKAGGHLITNFRPDNEKGKFNMNRDFYLLAEDHQLDFFPSKYFRGLIDEIDRMIFIDSETDKQAMKGIDPEKLTRAQIALKPFLEWRNKKEDAGKFSWTIALY